MTYAEIEKQIENRIRMGYSINFCEGYVVAFENDGQLSKEEVSDLDEYISNLIEERGKQC